MNQSEYILIANTLQLNRNAYKGTAIEAQAWEVTETLKYEFMRALSEKYKNFDGDKFLALFQG